MPSVSDVFSSKIGLFGILVRGKSMLKGREADGIDSPSPLTGFAFRAALRLEVKRNQTIGTGDIINQAALIANKPPQGDLNSSERYTPLINVSSEIVYE